ncbi:MAG: tetratricopeptide repeat protein [Magnetococcales bacterium]|nr:tetratricopeptide repeat protein [Magnetococcales bacterium]
MENLFQRALTHHGQGQLAEAMAVYRNVIAHCPDHAAAMNNLAMIHHDLGEVHTAIDLYRQALSCRPRFAEVLNNLGSLLHRQGNHDEAHDLLRQAIAIRPDYVAAQFNLGMLLNDMGRWDDALRHLREALARQPHHPEIHVHLGALCQRLQRHEEAMDHYRQGLMIQPNNPHAYNNLGQLCLDAGRLEEALDHLRHAVVLKADFPEAWNNLGTVLDALGESTHALECFARALELKAAFPEARNNCGNVLLRLGAPERALEWYRAALELRPEYPEALCNLGGCLHQLGRLDEALAALDRSLSLAPDDPSSHYNESLIRLLSGDYDLGWAKFEWRWRSRDFRFHGHRQPLWDGTPHPQATLLVHCEQGLGDSLQFVRFIPAIKSLVHKLILLCPEPLKRLFRTMTAIDQLITPADPIPPCDFQAPLMSLPHILRISLDSIPCPIPYLFPEEELIQPFRTRLQQEPTMKIGLTWRGNPRQKNDCHRSMAPEALAPLLDLPRCTFIGLQKETDPTAPNPFAKRNNFIDMSDELTDFAVTAALVSQLDLVISVDTSVIHLTGALGRPGWVLLTRVPDWRWLQDRSDSPWYPTLRLLRQSRRGDWNQVVATAVVKLKAVLNETVGLLDPESDDD